MKLSHITILSLLSITLLGSCRTDCGCGQLSVSSAALNVPVPNDNDVLPMPNAPNFEDYPATKLKGTSAPLHLKGKEPLYKTRLKEAYAKGPNFAGYLTITVIGFGTGSKYSYILDHRTGRVLNNPSGIKTSDEGMFESCGWPAHKLNSNLLIISPPYRYIWKELMTEKIDPTMVSARPDCNTVYMQWDGTGFKKIYEINIRQAMLSLEKTEL